MTGPETYNRSFVNIRIISAAVFFLCYCFFFAGTVHADAYYYNKPPQVQGTSVHLFIANAKTTDLFAVKIYSATDPYGFFDTNIKISPPATPYQEVIFTTLRTSTKYSVAIYTNDRVNKIQDLPSFTTLTKDLPPSSTGTTTTTQNNPNPAPSQTTLPSCLQKLTTLHQVSSDPNEYYYTDSTHGLIYLWISDHRYDIQNTGDLGNWSCDASNTLFLGPVTDKASIANLTQNNQATPITISASSTTGLSCVSTDGKSIAQCCDGIDNDKDGRADFYGTDKLPPDPKCLYYNDTEMETNPSTSTIIPCTDKCTLESVLQLVNNIINFFFTEILIPIFIVMLMYMGWQYFMAQGSPGQHAKLKKMFKNMVLGIVLILCAWLIVRTVLDVLLDKNTDTGKGALQFLE